MELLRFDPANAGHRNAEARRQALPGDRLAVTQDRGGATPTLYTLRLQTDGTVHCRTHKHGEPCHGRLTARVSMVRDGSQTPAFVSSPNQTH